MSNIKDGCAKICQDDLLLAVYEELEDEKSIVHIGSCKDCQNYINEIKKLRGVAQLAGMRSPENGLAGISKLEKLAENNPNIKKLDLFGKNLKTDVKFYRIMSKAAVLILMASALILAVLGGRELYPPTYLAGINDNILQIESEINSDIMVVFNDLEDDDPLTGLIASGEEIEDMEIAMSDIESGLVLFDIDDTDQFNFLDEDY